MTSLTWRYKTNHPLIGAGIDRVEIDRFDALLDGDAHPMPFVFTRKEIDRARALESAETGLAICFSAKEALFKAIGELYDFTGCELLPNPDRAASRAACDIVLGEELKKSHRIHRAVCRSYVESGDTTEVTSVVLAFGETGP